MSIRYYVNLFCLLASLAATSSAAARFNVTVDRNVHPNAVTGRVIVVVARSNTPEPRLQVAPNMTPIFATDVSNLMAGKPAVVDESSIAHPIASLDQLPAGDYFAEALLNLYQEFHRSDGHSVWVHFDMDGRPLQISAGNLYSDIKRVHLDPAAGFDVSLVLNHVIPAEPPEEDTKWVKHLKLKSELLSQFWGQPVYLRATVLLPKGYDEHPNVRYPVVYPQGFLGEPAFSFNDNPKEHENAQEAHRRGLQTGYEFYQSWISDHFPRFLAVTFIEATPFFPDGYNVNSANQGPYGDAITKELIPYVERTFRAITKPYARVLEGASTGGWGSLVLQLQHADMFGGAWVFYPDPIDFRRYQMVNIYEDDNAYAPPGRAWITGERPMRRSDEGQVTVTNRQMRQFEEVLGTKNRSGYQLQAWEAIYGPVGEDGYPQPLWDERTGKIDRSVAMYMRDHGYDLRYYAEKNWQRIGADVTGKLHFTCGDMDNFYLNLAVSLFEQFSKSTTGPPMNATFIWGRPFKGHWWHPVSFADTLREMAKQISANAPSSDSREWMSY